MSAGLSISICGQSDLPLLAITWVRDRRIVAALTTFPSVEEMAQLDFDCSFGEGEGCQAVVTEQAGRKTTLP